MLEIPTIIQGSAKSPPPSRDALRLISPKQQPAFLINRFLNTFKNENLYDHKIISSLIIKSNNSSFNKILPVIEVDDVELEEALAQFSVYLAKLQLCSQEGFLCSNGTAFYPLMGLDFTPATVTNVIGLTQRIRPEDIEKERSIFFTNLFKAFKRTGLSADIVEKAEAKSASHFVHNIDEDFYLPDRYLKQLEDQGISSVIVKGLTYYLNLWYEKQNGEIELPDLRKKINSVFRKLDGILPEGAHVLFFDDTGMDTIGEDSLYMFLIKELGYECVYSEVTTQDSPQMKTPSYAASSSKIEARSKSVYMYSSQSEGHRILLNGRLLVLKKPFKEGILKYNPYPYLYTIHLT